MPKAATSKHGKSKTQREVVIPDKLYFRIGDVAKLCGVETYVLRFWETQFPELRPFHTATKHRLYSAQDMEMLRLIKHLLYEEGFTIEGARKRIKELPPTGRHANAAVPANSPARKSTEKPARPGKTGSIESPAPSAAAPMAPRL